jgi:hypothetical protein
LSKENFDGNAMISSSVKILLMGGYSYLLLIFIFSVVNGHRCDIEEGYIQCYSFDFFWWCKRSNFSNFLVARKSGRESGGQVFIYYL